MRGDFLFDAAWCSFWAPFHAGIATVDPLSGLLQAPDIRAERSALFDAAARHQAVITVMEAARQAGLTQITFATQSSGRAQNPATPGPAAGKK